MEKKEIIPIILIIILSIVISIIIFKKDRTSKPEELDTSFFKVVSIKESLDIMKENEALLFYIGRKDCTACKSFEPTIQFVMADKNIPVIYIELSDIDYDSEEFANYKKILDNYEIEYDNETKPLSEYIGYTPLLYISKSNKILYGSIGVLSKEDLNNIIDKYGL